MTDQTTTPDPVHRPADEADIGSGEKNPGQRETEAIIGQIPPLPGDGAVKQAPPAPPSGNTSSPAAKP